MIKFYPIIITLISCACFSADLYVSPLGNDSNPGTQAQPLATFEAARNKVRYIREVQPNKDIVVLFREGSYLFDQTVVLDNEDSAPEGYKTVYASYPGEQAVFSSGYKVTGWTKLTPSTEPAYLPAAASGNIWSVRIPAAVGGMFKAMYDGQTELPRARSDGFKPTIGPNDPDIFDFAYTELHYPETAPFRQWTNMSDIEILIRPRVLWMMNILPLESVDIQNNIAHTALEAVYPMTQERFYRFPDSGSVWIENAIDFLDEPGEWVVDTLARKIYYWPASGTPSADVQVPLLKEFIRIQGEENFDVPDPVRGIVFDGIKFTCGERDTWTSDEAVIQHGWESYNKNNAMLRFIWSKDCMVRNCIFENSASTGLRFDFYSIGNKIYNNTFAHLGQSGVVISGYGPGIRNYSRENEIIMNNIYDCGRHYWHAHGIIVFQSGYNIISHNKVHDMPYTGITLTAMGEQFFTMWGLGQNEMSSTIRWDEVHINPYDYTGINGDSPTFREIERYLFTRNNLVEYNELTDVMKILGDGNAIYIRFCPRGNVIRRNYIHDIISEHIHGGIRCDDGQAEVSVTENIIYKCVRKGIVFKERNYVNNNIIACLYEDDDPANVHGVPLDGYIEMLDGAQTSDINRNIFYHNGDSAVDFIHEKVSGILEGCQSDYNIFYDVQNPSRAQSYLNGLSDQANSIAADPQFVDLAGGNLNLSPSSPAFTLGFDQIDFDAIGRYWPWDVNYNGTVGIDDLKYLSERWLTDDCFIHISESIPETNCFIDIETYADWAYKYELTNKVWQ